MLSMIIGHVACLCNSRRSYSLVNKSQICKLSSHFPGFFW